jgi:hypothetical protein
MLNFDTLRLIRNVIVGNEESSVFRSYFRYRGERQAMRSAQSQV